QIGTTERGAGEVGGGELGTGERLPGADGGLDRPSAPGARVVVGARRPHRMTERGRQPPTEHPGVVPAVAAAPGSRCAGDETPRQPAGKDTCAHPGTPRSGIMRSDRPGVPTAERHHQLVRLPDGRRPRAGPSVRRSLCGSLAMSSLWATELSSVDRAVTRM